MWAWPIGPGVGFEAVAYRLLCCALRLWAWPIAGGKGQWVWPMGLWGCGLKLWTWPNSSVGGGGHDVWPVVEGQFANTGMFSTLNQGLARTQSPTTTNYAVEIPTFGEFARVSKARGAMAEPRRG